MDSVKRIEKLKGVDAGYKNNVYPQNGEGRVGREGIDKTFTLAQMIDLAYTITPKPNIIVKPGKNSKWYLKYVPYEKINIEIDKQKNFRDKTNYALWIIEWDDVL
jgi:hypothetical protein